MRWWVTVCAAFAASCLPPAAVDCGDGRFCPTGTVCFADRCAAPEQIDACAAGEIDCTTSQIPDGRCVDGICVARSCDDGILDPPEQCEDLGDAPDDVGGRTCANLGFYTGELACEVDTCQFDVSGCAEYCGDGIVQMPHELCDGALPGKSCLDYGFDQGAATCSAACAADFTDCGLLGWSSELVAALSDIAVLADDLVVGVGVDGRFHRYVPSTGVFTSIHPNEEGLAARSVQRGPDGRVWALAQVNNVYHVYRGDAATLTMSRMLAPPGVAFTTFLPLANGFLIAASNHVTHVDLNGQVVASSTTGASRLRSDGTPTGAVTGFSNAVFRWDGSTMTQIAALPPPVVDVLARPDGSIWAMGRDPISDDCTVWLVGQGSPVKIFRTFAPSGCTGFAVDAASTPGIVTSLGVFAFIESRFQQIPGPVMQEVDAAGLVTYGFDAVGLWRLLPERWQIRHYYAPPIGSPPNTTQFIDVAAVDDDEYLYSDGLSVYHQSPAGAVMVASTPGLDLCVRGPRYGLVGFGNVIHDCPMGELNNCDTIQSGIAAGTSIVLDCTGDATEPLWIGYRSGNGTDGILLRADPPGPPMSLAGIRPYGIAALPGGIALAAGELDGNALVLAAGPSGVTTLYQAPGPALLSIHACAPDRWYAGGTGYVLVGDGAAPPAVELLPYPSGIVKIVATPGCDRVFAISNTVVFERRAGGWRPLRAANPGIAVLGATTHRGRVLVSRRLSIDELWLGPAP